jgi:predicted Rossmann fold flavoprotein
MSQTADVAIVGGGAAGLAAAIFAAQAGGRERRVVILDGARTLGAKILVSGGGRCNVTHDVVTPDDFNGSRNIVRNILSAFDAAAAVRWFSSLGVELKREETGKLFPITDSARTVLNTLLDRCRELGVTVLTGSRVGSVTNSDGAFQIHHTNGTLESPRVILTTGGRSLPRSGSDGSGWEIVKTLGHSVTETYPALVPLVLDPSMFHASVSGIAHEVELSAWADGKRIDQRTGGLLWTHFGISGPVVMDASRHWIIARETGRRPELRCNLLPPDGFEQAERWLVSQAANRPRALLVSVLAQRLPERIAGAVASHAKIDPTLTLGQLSREARRTLVHALTALPLPVAGPRGWNYAEVTAGGVPLGEIDFRTMQSRKVPGLFLAGEILDCDGRIGGFNFQWAWATGNLAGGAAARSLVSGSVIPS